MLKYHIWTIGCQMNKAESERLGCFLEERGYRATDAVKEADLILLNSCVVRQSAESRVINKLNDLKALKISQPDKTLAVTGCLVDTEIDQLARNFPYVDYFLKPGDYPSWLEMTEKVSPLPVKPSPSVFVPIMQGCNNYCSYCIVPYRRGKERSRPVPEVLCEVEELVKRGAREVILLGQNVDSYGHDLPDQPDLADLLTRLNAVEGLSRIRFLTNHPKDMSPKLIEVIVSLEKVCEQVNLPVQSGSNAILKLMRRGYNAEQYRQLITRIRSSLPGMALSTDIIVGFPSESDGQFQETVDLLSEIKFDTVHVASYSPRPGTAAFRELEDNITPTQKKERFIRVEQLQESIATEINARLLGETVEVLVVERARGRWQGRTRTDKLVFFDSKDNCLGKLVNITIKKTSPWSLQGSLE